MRRFFKSRPPLSGKHRRWWPKPKPRPESRRTQPHEFSESEPEAQAQAEPQVEPQDDATSDSTSDSDSEATVEIAGELKFTLSEAPAQARLLPGLLRTDKTTVRKFDSWYEFVSCAADESLAKWKRRASHGTESSYTRHGWFATSTFDQAVNMALNKGWPEGRKLLSDSLALVTPKPEPFRSEAYDVAGAYPIVQLYIAGDPATMVTSDNNITASKPVVRIDYCNSAHSAVSAECIMIRGAAVVSLAQTLEARGYSTEIRCAVYWTSEGCPDFTYQFVFKRAGEYLDIDRAAFALAHPSTMRRFGFALLEQHDELERGYNTNYGRTTTQHFDDGKPTIFIPGPRSGETPETARKAIADAASAYFTKDLAA
jgi:hypothetical protein